MAVTSIDIDTDALRAAKESVNAASNREVVDLALRVLVKLGSQRETVERIVATHHIAADQVGSGTIEYPVRRSS